MKTTRVCKWCKTSMPVELVTKTSSGFRCLSGYGCREYDCAATTAIGKPCSAGATKFRDNGYDGQLPLCGDHARGYDLDSAARGTIYAAFRVIHGHPPP